MKNTTDIHIVKSQIRISKAFLELMNEIGFSKINVQKITERAEINRSTFYAHYLDKFDLLDQVENRLLVGLKDIACSVSVDLTAVQGLDAEFLISYVSQIIYYMYENGNIFALLLSNKGGSTFIDKFIETTKSVWAEREKVEQLSIPQNYAFAAIIGMMTNLILEWVRNDFRETPEEFIPIVSKILIDIPQKIWS